MNNRPKHAIVASLPKLIKQARIEKGYTSAEHFANEHKISRSAYQRWESGKEMNISSFFYLCECLSACPIAMLQKTKQ